MSQPSIAIFDSGVGGLSIFEAVKKRLPQSSLVYVCDNKNFPYGPKPQEEVIACVLETVGKLSAKRSVGILVVACNTASTISLPLLRENFSFPIVGVVPAVKPAATLSQSKVIALLATPRTVASKYTDNLIAEHAAHCKVVRVGSAKLAELAERKLRGRKPSLEEVRQEILPLFSVKNLDAVVLGCTHFPLLIAEFKQLLPGDIAWIDSSEAISARVDAIFGAQQSGPPFYEALFSDELLDLDGLKPYLKSLGIEKISAL